MARQEISAVELRRKLSETLSQVSYQDQEVVITRNGTPLAVLVSLQTYEQLQAAARAPQSGGYELSERARRSLERLPPEVRNRLTQRMQALAANLHSPDSRELYTGAHRIAVGGYRIIYSVADSGRVHVTAIGTREECYRELRLES